MEAEPLEGFELFGIDSDGIRKASFYLIGRVERTVRG